ncbi:histone deacetylase complex subunit SAP30L-like, partial [Sinocyclocheilus rhinocerous]|uniref:histone deacetylase complex subunit SAP30L-like n=1 Tax=Sinocyclocheilus rhinocerous TaxID=307959 RepID=UPI0007B96572
MNGFSTEEDSHDAPPAPPFFGQSCCLIEDGERCGRAAGNASFSKRIQKSISQRKLKLDIDKSVRHLYICDFHKNFIQSVRNKRKRKTSDDGGESPEHDAEVPEVNQDSSLSCCCSISARFVSQLLSRPYKILHYLVM